MLILYALAIISLILGILFLINGNILKYFSEAINKTIMQIMLSSRYNKVVGIILILFAVFLFFISLKLKH